MNQSVLLANFLHPRQRVEAETADKLFHAEFLHGIHIAEDTRDYRLRIARDLLSAILLHDEVFVTQLSFLELLKLLGPEDCLRLLDECVLTVVNDRGFTPVLRKAPDGYEALTLTDVSPDQIDLASNEKSRFEQRLPLILREDQFRLNLIQTSLEKHTNSLPSLSEIGKLVQDELQYDLRNGNVRNLLGIESASSKNIQAEDAFKVLRLLEANSDLVLTKALKASAVHIEAGGQRFIRAKFPPATPTLGSTDSIQVFESILSGKSIPDLGTLYVSKILSLSDVLKIREGVDGVMFRQWIASSHYNKEIVIKKLLEPKVAPALLEKLVRWIVPNALKISDHIGGGLMAKGSSYLLNSFLDDWHPSFFLDQSLADAIDRKLASYHAQNERDKVRTRFGKIGRNDSCPCGSGIKFKKCHGRFL